MSARIGRHLALALVACVGVAAAGAGAVAVLGAPRAGVSSSRVAADRSCPDVGPSPDVERLDGGPFELVQVADADQPSALALLPGRDDGVLGERLGRLRRVTDGAVTDDVVLDVRDDTFGDGDAGLLAAVYAPDGRWLYVHRTTHDRDDVITAYPVDDDGVPAADDARVILHIDHPVSQQHHGGSLLFGADGLLYVGTGDGGGLGDPRENAQDPSDLLGKVLRIDPTPDGPRPYVVPPDNPFVGRFGWRPEIWVLGVRNPFRMALDDATGDLWLGDVGQSCWEELDHLPPDAAGANLGWDRREADADFEGGDVPGRELAPVHAYPHSEGWCAIVVGYIPHDGPDPVLDGWLLHTDYCAGRILALRPAAADPPEIRDLGVRADTPVAIVRGPAGRPWILSLEGKILELRTR